MNEILLSTLAGIVLGGVFTAIRLPIPAPITLAGVMAVLGVWLGYTIVKALGWGG